jgi:hypothetical protein
MKKNKRKLSLLAFLLVCFGMNLTIATKAFAEISDNKANAATDSNVQETNGFCICPYCGEKQKHKLGTACNSINCSKCNSKMIKYSQKNSDDVEINKRHLKQNTPRNSRFSEGKVYAHPQMQTNRPLLKKKLIKKQLNKKRGLYENMRNF